MSRVKTSYHKFARHEEKLVKDYPLLSECHDIFEYLFNSGSEFDSAYLYNLDLLRIQSPRVILQYIASNLVYRLIAIIPFKDFAESVEAAHFIEYACKIDLDFNSPLHKRLLTSKTVKDWMESNSKESITIMDWANINRNFSVFGKLYYQGYKNSLSSEEIEELTKLIAEEKFGKTIEETPEAETPKTADSDASDATIESVYSGEYDDLRESFSETTGVPLESPEAHDLFYFSYDAPGGRLVIGPELFVSGDSMDID